MLFKNSIPISMFFVERVNQEKMNSIGIHLVKMRTEEDWRGHQISDFYKTAWHGQGMRAQKKYYHDIQPSIVSRIVFQIMTSKQWTFAHLNILINIFFLNSLYWSLKAYLMQTLKRTFWKILPWWHRKLLMSATEEKSGGYLCRVGWSEKKKHIDLAHKGNAYEWKCNQSVVMD